MRPQLSLLFALGFALLGACSHQPNRDDGQTGVFPLYASESTAPSLPLWMHTTTWRHQKFPGKRHTTYSAQMKLGREALVAKAESSMSVMRTSIRLERQSLGALKFLMMRSFVLC
jgi:hypothetical protein